MRAAQVLGVSLPWLCGAEEATGADGTSATQGLRDALCRVVEHGLGRPESMVIEALGRLDERQRELLAYRVIGIIEGMVHQSAAPAPLPGRQPGSLSAIRVEAVPAGGSDDGDDDRG